MPLPKRNPLFLNLFLCLAVAGFIALPAAASTQAAEVESLYSSVNECGAVDGNCSDYTTQQLSANDFQDKLPKINEFGDVAWQGRPADADYEIFVKAGDSVTIEQITDNEFDDIYPWINNSREITWMGHDGTDWDIYLNSNGTTSKLSSNPLDDLYPRINNLGDVVWLAVDGHDYEIYRYSEGNTEQITDNEVNDVQVRLNDSGDLMWRRKAEMSSDIFLLSGDTTTQVNSDDLHDHNPQLNNNADLVWEVSDGNDCEIVLKLAADTTPVQITDNETEDWFPMINASGVVVWQGNDGNDNEIFAYDNGVITQITDNSTEDLSPQINDAGDIAWLSMGDAESGIGIYMYQASTQTINKLSDSYSGHYDSVPDINNQGKIVWSGWDGNDFEIVIASAPLSFHDEIRFRPRTLNLQSKGKGFAVGIELPQPYSASSIDPESVVVSELGSAGPLAEPLASTGKYKLNEADENGLDGLVVIFDRQALIDLLKPLGTGIVDLTMSGSFYDGTVFTAVNSLKVVDRKASGLNKAKAEVRKLKEKSSKKVGKKLAKKKLRFAKMMLKK